MGTRPNFHFIFSEETLEIVEPLSVALLMEMDSQNECSLHGIWNSINIDDCSEFTFNSGCDGKHLNRSFLLINSRVDQTNMWENRRWLKN